MRYFRIIIIFTVVISMCLIFSSVAYASADVDININGKNVSFTTSSGVPFIDSNSRTLVPLRVTMESYGCEVDWDSSTKTASVTKEGTTVLVPIGQSYIFVNGNKVTNDTSAQIVNSRTYLPIRAVLEAFGASVSWDGNIRTVIVATPGQVITYKIALITEIAAFSNYFNQASWEGISDYSTQNQRTLKYYVGAEQTTEAYLEAVSQAITNGAEIIIAPNFAFSETVYIAQDLYPDISFVLVDATPQNADYFDEKTADNTVDILFSEEESGYLAGYAVVKEGYTSLGFMGGAPVPAVVRYGYGFLQGAEDAATEMGITNISVKYHYTYNFIATPETQALAASWYNSGVNVIFACGGALADSVIAAAETANGKVVGVDVDQSGDSNTVITSALKNVSSAVFYILDKYYNNNFPGGEEVILGANMMGVGLPMNTSRFSFFTQTEYDQIMQLFTTGTINLQTDEDAASPTALGLQHVVITMIE